jgi:ankyrin repeat protein
MISIHLAGNSIQATGNHPFYVVRGKRLATRPLPHDVPKQEQRTPAPGRWVEARDLTEGDVLLDKSGGGLIVTGLSIRDENTEVYNLEVEGFHNYAIHRMGILVHNKAGKEEASEPESLVTVYGTVTLEHYEVSVLGAKAGSALLEWLQQNEYHVDPSAQEILDSYIGQDWALVAVKLNPGERRRYENEFLPPRTIQYQNNQLVFPLRISSVSTSRTVKITLYVIAESTVVSSNFPTQKLNYDKLLAEPVVPEIYIDACIQKTAGKEDRGMVVMWSGKFAPPDDEKNAVERLMKRPFPEKSLSYLTRLEARIDTEAMTEDVNLVLDPQPEDFLVDIQSDGRWTTGEDVEAREKHGATELMYAGLDEQDTDWINSVLKSGADVNALDTLDATALMYAARYNPNPEVISTLLNAGSDVNALNSHGWSAIFYAARNPNPEVISILMNAGADINLQDRNGWTALMWAAYGGHAEIVRLLLEAGADVNAKSEIGQTALMEAVCSRNPEVVELLLQAGADVNARNKLGDTALIYAKRVAPPRIIELLKKAGAKK